MVSCLSFVAVYVQLNIQRHTRNIEAMGACASPRQQHPFGLAVAAAIAAAAAAATCVGGGQQTAERHISSDKRERDANHSAPERNGVCCFVMVERRPSLRQGAATPHNM